MLLCLSIPARELAPKCLYDVSVRHKRTTAIANTPGFGNTFLLPLDRRALSGNLGALLQSQFLTVSFLKLLPQVHDK